MLLSYIEIVWGLLKNSVDLEQTAHLEAVWSGSTLFASILLLNNKQTLSNVVITPHFQILPMSKVD